MCDTIADLQLSTEIKKCNVGNNKSRGVKILINQRKLTAANILGKSSLINKLKVEKEITFICSLH